MCNALRTTIDVASTAKVYFSDVGCRNTQTGK